MGSIPATRSRFEAVEHKPLGGPFKIEAAYRSDTSEDKVNLGIGAYRDDAGQPWLLPSVAEAKKRMDLPSCTHEYSPLHGIDAFIEPARRLVFGAELDPEIAPFVASMQTVSGTGANSIIAKFLARWIQPQQIWLPAQTWDNHPHIWRQNAPAIQVRDYPYYDQKTCSLDFAGLMATLERDAKEGDAILLHACAHNPTGIDPTEDQWKDIALLCEKKRMFVVFDSAYQGFAFGNLDKDAWSIRHFATHPDLEFAVCQSFSKNLGLYGERVGALHIVTSRNAAPSVALAIRSQLVEIHRGEVSIAPAFGARVATTVLTSEEIFSQWLEDLVFMSGRIKAMRQALFDELVALGTPGSWKHVVDQTGMFSYTGLSTDQVAVMQEKFHIYMLPTGRISICGLRDANVKYVARAIDSVVREGKA
ncbi:aspartate aminotransferase [Emericellopsis atlantica]|uniref:Aspartate aminotransferase n=1 Tax=Emericellopsis atlantica TaxID=2614577 RepID=A0A9P7ZIL0_9HYPO|nr:aspartate aminotransferase [Emericellopsis atlantica]KAG9252396.1 aspartate aminotransferase [Emericellopsis atlantica]